MCNCHGEQFSYDIIPSTYCCSVPMKEHLLKCCRTNKNVQMEAKLTAVLHASDWQCMWRDCSKKTLKTASFVAIHISEHVAAGILQCQWGTCCYQAPHSTELHSHLSVEHGIYTRETIPTRAKFCFECSIWTSSELEWRLHASQHASCPDDIYGPVFSEGILAAGRRCPYCMRNGLFLQMDNNLVQYREHIDDHMRQELGKEAGLYCPHPQCERRSYGKNDLRAHLDRVHMIPMLQ
jgi:hypothetical protein